MNHRNNAANFYKAITSNEQVGMSTTIEPITSIAHRKPAYARHRQAGFTLFELLVVVVILGVLAAIAAPIVGDGQKMADVTAYFKTADRISANWKFVSAKCQTGSNIDSQTITGAATPAAALTSNLQLLVNGTGAAANYAGCVAAAKLEPLNRNFIRGASGAYTLNGDTVSVANVVQNGMNRVAVTYQSVDNPAALELVQKYGGQAGAASLSTLGVSDLTDTAIQYGVLANGVRSVTIIR